MANNIQDKIENVKARGRRILQTVQAGAFTRQIGQGQLIKRARELVAERRTRGGSGSSVSVAERTFQIGDGRPASAVKDVLDLVV